MPAMDIMTFQTTAIGATLAAMAAAAGDSAVVPSYAPTDVALLLQAWVTPQAAGTVRIRSPRFHDNVNGIRYRTTSADQKPFLPWGAPEKLAPMDTIIAELAGSATAGDIEYLSLIRYFANVPGLSARLVTWDQIKDKIDHVTSVENTLSTPTTGGYAASTLLNATIDQIQAGFDYAILGYKCDTKTHAITWKCPEFANLRVGGPGDPSDFDLYSDWFKRLSIAYGLPLIPVFNGTNKGTVNVEAVQDENGADPVVTTWLAKLRP